MRGIFVLCAALALALPAGALAAPAVSPEWSMNATIIEACSCPMFCQCYFNTEPAGHGEEHDGHGGGEHFCRFNNAFKINQGHYGAVKLDGLKFWMAGDLGAEFSKGMMDWAILTFEPTATKEQRDAVSAILGKTYPVTWNSFTLGPDAGISWTATKDRAEAKADGGKVGEVILERFPGMSAEPIVISNLKYWGAPRNTGFQLMPNLVEAWRGQGKPFEFMGGNGFMITIDIASKDMS